MAGPWMNETESKSEVIATALPLRNAQEELKG
jgi:hypothetical protein